MWRNDILQVTQFEMAMGIDESGYQDPFIFFHLAARVIDIDQVEDDAVGIGDQNLVAEQGSSVK